MYYINANEIPNHFTFRCERCDLLCNHSNGDLFTCEDNMLFSRVKTSCFRAKAHLVSYWCLYNKTLYVATTFFVLRASVVRMLYVDLHDAIRVVVMA